MTSIGRVISEREAMRRLHVGPPRFHRMRKAGVIVPLFTEDNGQRVYSETAVAAFMERNGATPRKHELGEAS